MPKDILPRHERGNKDGARRKPRDTEPDTKMYHQDDASGSGTIDVADLPLEIFRKRLRGIRGNGPNFMACCPAHRDTKPSLSVTELPDGTVLLNCFAKCPIQKVLEALGLKFQHLYPSGYAQQFNKRGSSLRSVTKSPPKSFATVEEPVINHERFRKIICESRAHLGKRLLKVAGDLRVTEPALNSLRIGVLDKLAVFPERDDRRRPVGICYRSREGDRKFEKGGKRGLTIPVTQPTDNGPLYIAEGATDAAALLAAGVRAIGRPSAKLSALATLWLVRYLERHDPDTIVVVGDNNDPDRGEGVGEVAARELAEYLATRLGRSIMWGLPRLGFKDVREQYAAGEWSRGLRKWEARA
ncbi:MAG: hypothetical protein C0467_12665 [Planctomycetaceae bacterium]|nr:hypothetical protein [Planctomycetaceae bacterium]